MNRPAKRILVIDDEPDMVRVATDLLHEEGYVITSASGASEATRKLHSGPPDLILLDIRLPIKNGFEILKDLKKDPATRAVPVIMVSIKGEEADKVLGLELGADDYVTKPYSRRELAARVKAVLRRHESREEEPILEEGGIRLNLSTCDVQADGKLVILTPKEIQLLGVLLRRPGRILNRTYLFETVWGYEHVGTTRTVDVHMEQLRRKLGPAGKQIVTLKGLGYKFQPQS
jgi:DNA-binding response OmpR family regulator